jgi:hypothetical protein
MKPLSEYKFHAAQIFFFANINKFFIKYQQNSLFVKCFFTNYGASLIN